MCAFVSLSQAWEWVRDSTLCPFAANAKVWIGPEWNVQVDPTQNLESLAIDLKEFCSSVTSRRYAGFVMEVVEANEDVNSLDGAARVFRWLLTELACRDPSGTPVQWRDIESSTWQFRFAETNMFMNLFAPCYPTHHTKHIPFRDRIVIFCQPEVSFDFCNVNRS